MLNEGRLARSIGETDAKLDAQQKSAVAICIVLNPQFSIGIVCRDAIERGTVADLALDARLNEFFVGLFDLGEVG